MKKPFLVHELLLGGVGLLSSCAAVYVPTTPGTPLLEKGQVEVTAGIRSLRSVEVGAAWSPLAHVLLTGELATGVGKTTTTTTNGAGTSNTYIDAQGQGSLGLGLYTSTAKRSYWALMSGVGWGHTRFFAYDDYKPASVFFPFPVPTSSGVYDAQYHRYYGQVYFANPETDQGHRFGGSLRAVWLDYARLTYSDVAIVPSTRLYVEPSVFWRFGQGPVRYFATAGLSIPWSSNRDNPSNSRTSSTSYLFGGGIILRPDLLRRKQ